MTTELTFGYTTDGAAGGGGTLFTHIYDNDNSDMQSETWYKIKWKREGSDLKLYIDDVLVETFNIGTDTIAKTSTKLRVGNRYHNGNAEYDNGFLGHIDQVIISHDGIGTDYASVGCVNAQGSVFSGLSHLEGETVAILADGEVLPQQVVTNGAITLSKAYSVVQVGLPYHSDIETLDIEVDTEEADTLQGRKLKVGNVSLGFVESRGGKVGDSEDNLYSALSNLMITRNQSELAFNEDLTTLNASTRLYTGLIRVPLGSKYRQGGRVFFRQEDPLPVTITQVIPEIAVGGVI